MDYYEKIRLEKIQKIKEHLVKGGRYEQLTDKDFMFVKNYASSFNDIKFVRRNK